MAWVLDTSDGALLRIHASPRASRNRIQGTHGDALKVSLRAPPVDGKANMALLEFMAQCLDLPRRQLSLAGGETAREKRVLIRGLDAATVRHRLNLPIEGRAPTTCDASRSSHCPC